MGYFHNNLDVYLVVKCQDVVPMGPIVEGMDIDSDDEDNPEGPTTGLASIGEAAQAPPAKATPFAPKQSSSMQQGETPDVAKVKVGATVDKPALSLLGLSKRGRPDHKEVQKSSSCPLLKEVEVSPRVPL
jgi:hypothetical protein